MSAVDDIRLKVQARLDEIEEEIESLRVALAALDAQSGAAPVQAPEQAAPASLPRSRPGARRAPAGRRSTASVRATTRRGKSAPSPELERQLVETGGASAVELAQQTGTDYAEVLARIRELEQAARRNRDAA